MPTSVLMPRGLLSPMSRAARSRFVEFGAGPRLTYVISRPGRWVAARPRCVSGIDAAARPGLPLALVVGGGRGRLRGLRAGGRGLGGLLGHERLGLLAGQRVVLGLDRLVDLLLGAGGPRVAERGVFLQVRFGLLEALGLALAGLGQGAPRLAGALAGGAGVLGRAAADVRGLVRGGVLLGGLVEARRVHPRLRRRGRGGRGG